MKFSFNPKRDPGNRVLKNSVTVNDEPLQKNKVCVIYEQKQCNFQYLESLELCDLMPWILAAGTV